MSTPTTLDLLNTVLTNVTNNRTQISAHLTTSTAQAGELTAEVKGAIDVLLKVYGNPQGAAQIMNSVFQIEQLQKTSVEMDAMIAGLQVVISDESLLEAATAQAQANAEAATSPLPAAAAGSQPVAAAPAGIPAAAAGDAAPSA